jgi:PKD repeat protein
MKTQMILMVAIVCLVLGVSDNAKAEPELIIEDGSATRILNLPVVDENTNVTTVYDVDFVFSDVEGVYGPNLDFDFPGDETILEARQLVFAVLNGANQSGTTADSVGPEADDQFFIGNKMEDGLVVVLGGEDFFGYWDTCEVGCINVGTLGGAALLEPGEFFTYADFTVVDTGGVGNLPPKADAYGPYAGAVEEDVTFDGTGSSDPDGDIVTWEWDFGDNSTGTGETTTHAYSTAGIYNVTLTVTDDDDVPASDTTAAFIGELNRPPVADAGGPYAGTVDAAVTFDGTSSDDPDGEIVSYDWDFGDGSFGTGETTSHTYTMSREYNVILTVRDDGDKVATDTTAANITIGNLPPTADADGPYEGVVGASVTFDGTGSIPGGEIVSYNWIFGDGGTDTGPTPSYTYSTANTYNVILIVTDDVGARDSDSTTATITIIGDDLTVTSPSSGDRWAKGQTYDVEWSYDNPSPNVKIVLFKGDSKVLTIKNPTPNDGSYSWKIPTSLSKGTNYSVKVIDLDDTSVFDFSDDFEIVGACDLFTPIEVVDPSISTVLELGEDYSIEWTGGESNQDVKIDLFKGGTLKRTLTESTANDGQFDVTVDYGLTPGSNYQIRVKVKGSDCDSLTDKSDNFEIEAPEIDVEVPDSVWNLGGSYRITWSGDPGIPGEVKLKLFKGNSGVKTIKDSIPYEDENYTWGKVPYDLSQGDNYRVKVISKKNDAIFGFSDYFEIAMLPINVTLPVSETEWSRGNTYEIRWTGGKPSKTVKIIFLKAGEKVNTITSSTANDGLFKWKVPGKLDPGSDYSVKVVYLPNTEIQDTSDTFTVSGDGASETVILDDNNNVIRIENLEMILDQDGHTVFNVDFVNDTAFDIYGALLDFPFTEEDSVNAMEQVTDALNTNSPVPPGAGPLGTDQFFIGVDEELGTELILSLGGENFSGIWDQCEIDCVAGVATQNPAAPFTYAVFTPVE